MILRLLHSICIQLSVKNTFLLAVIFDKSISESKKESDFLTDFDIMRENTYAHATKFFKLFT